MTIGNILDNQKLIALKLPELTAYLVSEMNSSVSDWNRENPANPKAQVTNDSVNRFRKYKGTTPGLPLIIEATRFLGSFSKETATQNALAALFDKCDSDDIKRDRETLARRIGQKLKTNYRKESADLKEMLGLKLNNFYLLKLKAGVVDGAFIRSLEMYPEIRLPSNALTRDMQRDVRLPDVRRISEEEAETIGAVWHRGSIHKSKTTRTGECGLVIRSSKDYLYERLAPLCEKSYNVPISVDVAHRVFEHNECDQNTAGINSVLVTEFYRRVLGFDNDVRKIPECISAGTDEARLGFIRGVLCGGSLKANRELHLVDRSTVYTAGLHGVLDSLGIRNNLRDTDIMIMPNAVDLLYRRLGRFPRREMDEKYWQILSK